MEYVVVDLETTGFSPQKGSEIIEIGVTKIVDNNITLNYSRLIKPKRTIPPHITKITNISNEMVREEESLESVLPRFREYVGDTLFIAHNAKFDLRFLNFFLEEMSLPKIENYICTLDLLKDCKKYDQKSKKLSDVCQFFNIGYQNAHRADADTFVTAQLFLKLQNLKGDR